MTDGSPPQMDTLITRVLRQHLGDATELVQLKQVSGGCINKTFVATVKGGKQWFIKLNSAELLDMFIAEAAGLQAIRATNTLCAPACLGYGIHEPLSYLLLEYLDLQGPCNPTQTGIQLAAMHQHSAPLYGWYRDNTIGSTPQSNSQQTSWIRFWQQERLGFQLQLARQNGYSTKAYERGMTLLQQTAAFFAGYQPVPSLLHGDLWNGNLGYSLQGTPIIYDPAVYYGDREVDLAMTELFGGFGVAFYASYHEVWPLDDGYHTRKTLYNLYHILNHFNLFGSGYERQAARMTEQLLAEL